MELNNYNYNDIDGSISLTFSDSNDDVQIQNDNKLHQNELEISYKSAFFSDKKCKEQKALSQQIDCKTLFKKEEIHSPKSPEYAFAQGISVKNTATTSEAQTGSVNNKYNYSDDNNNKNISNYSISDVKSISSNKYQGIDIGINNSNSNKYVSTYDNKEHQMLSKRSKSSNFDIALNKIKIDSIINSGITCQGTSSSTSHIRGSPIINNANPFLNNNNNTVNYNNISHSNSNNNDTTKPNPKTTKLILHKNKKTSTTPLPINKALSSHRDQVHTYLKQMMKQYSISSSEIKKNSQKPKNPKRTSYSHSHREKQFPNMALCDINPKTKKKISSNLIKHTSSSSCLLLKKNQNSFKSSQSTYSFFNNSSSCFMKESPSINTKNKRNCFYSTLNTPTNLKSKKIDSRNSMLKSNLNSLNKKQCNTPHLGSSVSIGNSNLTQRLNNNKKIYIQSPHNLFHNKKNIIPFIKGGIKTSPSPPKLRETNKQHKDSKDNAIKSNCNSNTSSNHHTTITGGSNGKKQVYTINNFSKYVKKSRGTKEGKKSLHGDSFVHSTSNHAPKIYLKASKDGEGEGVGRKGKGNSKQKQVPKEIMLNY